MSENEIPTNDQNDSNGQDTNNEIDVERSTTEREKSNNVPVCCGGNTHIWKIENGPIDFCTTFSDYQVNQVAIGGEHILILTSDLKVYTYGSNSHGQLGQGDCDKRSEICLVNALQDKVITHIACGERHSAVLDNAGAVYTWGDSTHGQCGLRANGIFTTPLKVCFPQHRQRQKSMKTNLKIDYFDTKIKSISCGEFFSVAIDSKGSVWSWGMGCGLGHGENLEIALEPKQIKRLSQKKATAVACGSYHCFVVTQDDYIDSPFPIQLSPNYRSSSVSSNYYTELKAKSSLSTSKVPFLKSKLTTLETASITTSSTDLSKDNEYFFSEGLSSSNPATAQIKNSNNSKSFDETTNLSISPFVASSQYYSVDDIKSNTVINFNSPTLETTSQGSVETTSSSSLETVEPTSEAVEDFTIEQEDLFNSRKSLFDETNNEAIARRRSNAVSSMRNKISMLSEDDSINELCSDLTNMTEVWSFGKNSYGQLGLGDVEDRFEPTLVQKLSTKGIIKITCGSYHTLLLSSQGKVYSCGDNAFGQLGQTKAIVPIPKKIRVLESIRVWDFAAGRNFCIFLGDSDKKKTDVYFCGDGKIEKSKNKMSVVVDPVIEKKRPSSRWKIFKKNSLESGLSSNSINVQLRRILHYDEKDLVKRVIAKDFTMGSLTHIHGLSTDKSFAPIYKFVRCERLLYQQLITIQKYVIEPFIKTGKIAFALEDSWENITKLVGGEALLLLIDSFLDLLNGISTEVIHLTDIVCCSLPIEDMFMFVFSDSFRTVYERYGKCYADALAVGSLQTCMKPCNTIISKQKDLMKNLERDLSLTQGTFETFMKVPLLRCHVYSDLAKRISSHCKQSIESAQLKEVIGRWLDFSENINKKLTHANTTNKFWNESHHKLVENLKDPQRRVLKSSKNDPLTLARASRLASHSYILCNDVFVHVQFNRNFQVYPLVTLWADSEPDTDYMHNGIKITSPEESFVLVAGTSDGKLVWLKELNQAIATCLATCSSLKIDDTSVNTSGLLKAAVAREAKYTYTSHMSYRNAVYNGMWMAGEPHGRGTMTWDDGQCYEGEFSKGVFEGYGRMFYPENVNNAYEKVYEGDWKDGKMNGYGKMSYGQNEEYIGHFKDSMRSGHGTLKFSSSKNILDTIYVGNWADDVKSGYGVLDYIVRGEKYMGLWANNQRNGFGVVVTVDGVYYEGCFNQNKLAGRGTLLNEDDTRYEGEFTADMLLNGKGVLTLPNGDFIDGIFYGNWGAAIKVTGSFSKFTNTKTLLDSSNSDRYDDRQKLTNFTIDTNMKWKSLFDECFEQLGCEDDNIDIEPEYVWRKVNESIMKATGTLSHGLHSRFPIARMDLKFVRRNSFKEHMKKSTNLKAMQEFLEEAFKTNGHPLHTLVDALSEVYRATYVGVGTHRRLLSHAVTEAKSYMTRLFNVLRVLFPDLHDEEFVMLSNETFDGYVSPPVNSVTLLHPLILPRLYPPLFTLYALHTEKSDALYTEKLHYLNRRGDMALLSFLGVRRDFWLLPHEHSDEERSHKVYIEPIDTLKAISTTYSPMGKIDVLRKTFGKINEEVEKHFKGVRKVLAMDDLFPLFQFIVIRARIPHLGSEIQFIEDLIEESVMVGEAGHMLTTLSACYFQIQQERDRDT